MQLRRLFEPGTINKTAIRNRIVMSSALTKLAGPEGHTTDRQIAYYAARAGGGAGIVNVGYAFVSMRGKATTYQTGIHDDSMIPGLRRLTGAAHEAGPGVRVGCQLAHTGRQSRRSVTGLRPEAPSPIPSTRPYGTPPETPEEMSAERIAELVREFGEGARRAREAGFDLVEFHGAHGYLGTQFLSPLTNHRADGYGGSPENRLRFVLECLSSMRRAVGDDFPVGIRINGDDFEDGGLGLDDYVLIAKRLEESGLVDYVSVSAGGHHETGVAAMVAPMAVPQGFLEHLGAGIRGALNRIPVFIVGRIKDPVMAESILERGSADYCVMTRALMADPELPNKAREGHTEDIRYCIGCMQGCSDRTWAGLDLTCLVNPVAGSEAEWGRIEPAPARKRVLVVGGGPAGMETARLAALRGHDVTLWEKTAELGGTTLLAAKPPRREDFRDLPRWLAGQVRKAGVHLELGREADAAKVLEFAPDVLVAATGARPYIPRHIPGHDLPHVTNAYDVLAGSVGVGERVVVVGGDHRGAETAEYLADRGHAVTLVGAGETETWDDPLAEIAYDHVGFTARTLFIPMLTEKVNVRTMVQVKRIEAGGVVIGPAGLRHPCTRLARFDGDEDETIPADTVIISLAYRPVDGWMRGLEGFGGELHVIGDCLEPRDALLAIRDAARIGREI